MGLDLRSSPVSVQDHMKYKYLISVDGWTCAWFRPQLIMSSNSVLLKQESSKVETFYHRLIPFKHYVPVLSNLSNLLEMFKYMESNQSHLLQIVKDANQFGE